jgi:hypothetical protein
MQYRLRTLLILLAILPPLIWFGWTRYEAWRAEQERWNIIVEALAASYNTATWQAIRSLSQAPPPPSDDSVLDTTNEPLKATDDHN